MEVVPDARSHHYRDAHQLALLILRSRRVSAYFWKSTCMDLPGQNTRGRREGSPQYPKSPPRTNVEGTKEARARNLSGRAPVRCIPDLVFGDDNAVGDVKYLVTTNGDIRKQPPEPGDDVCRRIPRHKSNRGRIRARTLGEQVKVGDVNVRESIGTQAKTLSTRQTS